MVSPRKRKYDVTYKVLVVGEQGVGKTALLDRYSNPDRPFDPHLLPTIGIDFRTCYETVDTLRLRIQIWDTVGQERFRTMNKLYFRGAKGILLVFDLTDRNSFLQVYKWINDLKEENLERECLILVGNKTDLIRAIERKEGEQLARGLGVRYYETSAKTGMQVDEVFSQLITDMKDANNRNDQGGVENENSNDLDEDWELLFKNYFNENNPKNCHTEEITRSRGCCSI